MRVGGCAGSGQAPGCPPGARGRRQGSPPGAGAAASRGAAAARAGAAASRGAGARAAAGAAGGGGAGGRRGVRAVACVRFIPAVAELQTSFTSPSASVGVRGYIYMAPNWLFPCPLLHVSKLVTLCLAAHSTPCLQALPGATAHCPPALAVGPVQPVVVVRRTTARLCSTRLWRPARCYVPAR